MDLLEDLWGALLSGEPPRIRRVWGDLTDEEALSVLAHLNRMVEADGWTAEQRAAAAFALQILRDQPE